MSSIAAVDLGATSGRVIVGSINDGRLHLDHVARFPNTPVRIADGLHWDVLALWNGAMTGLADAAHQHTDLLGAAIDSWAVDYGLLRGPRLLGNPYHYRDQRTQHGADAVHAEISRDELYRRNGLQHLPFNTLFQLAASAADGELEVADRLLLIPDLLGFWATGTQVAERTNASTTGLVPVAGNDWDTGLIATLGVRPALLPPIVEPGTSLGELVPTMRDEFNIGRSLLFSTVGSHDTASAVAGIPLRDEGSVYISCGTWSLVGAELDAPVTTDEAREAGFTNESGVDARVRFLKNVMGLWLLSESMRDWQRRGETWDLTTLVQQAGQVPADVPTFDANDPRLLAPGDMPARIESILRETGQRIPNSAAEFVRTILQSLANAYADAVTDLSRLTGRTPLLIHLAGGGAQNELLCQLTADATGLPLHAGPVEATAIGNLLVQARTHGLLVGGLESLRAVVEQSVAIRYFQPQSRSMQRG